VGALALVALAIVVCRRTDWSRGFSPDGVLAFAGGALALLGVWWSNHQSVKNLQKQLEAERNARTEEAERQKRSIATAILYEIDNFYRMELDLVEKNLASRDAAKDNLATAVGLRTNISEIYKAVSPILGSLNAKSVSAIVRFHSMVGAYEGL